VVVLVNKRNSEETLLSVPMLYLLFLLYVVGIALGTWLVGIYDGSIGLPNVNRRLAVDFGQYVLYCSIVLLVSGRSWGVLAIPLLLWFRAFFYGVAASMVIRSQVWNWKMIAELCAPTAFHLMGLLYLASLGVMLSMRKRKRHSLCKENVKELRSGVFFSAACGVMSAITKVIF